jgi:hypothetical protein
VIHGDTAQPSAPAVFISYQRGSSAVCANYFADTLQKHGIRA